MGKETQIYVKNLKINYQDFKDLPDYLIRAKISRRIKEGKVIGGVLATIIAVAGIGASVIKTPKVAVENNNTEISAMMEDNKVTIERFYTVVDGDSLSLISANTGISVSDIQQENNMEPTETLIHPNQKLRLSYEVDSENLQYCTDRVSVAGKTLEEIASEYGTTAETLLRLNESVVERTHSDDYTVIDYKINSDTIIVPNFIMIRDGIKGNQK